MAGQEWVNQGNMEKRFLSKLGTGEEKFKKSPPLPLLGSCLVGVAEAGSSPCVGQTWEGAAKDRIEI